MPSNRALALRNRPYKVGMSRNSNRYIEPDQIYTEFRPGRPTSIPRDFPWTWNPVNGLGGVDGILEDLEAAGRSIIGAGTQAGKDKAKDVLLDQLNNTPAGKALLETVKAQAAEGVTDVVKQNAPNLIMLAVAGGAVGGALSAKLGKTGTVLALLVGGFAAFQLINTKPPA